MFTLVALEDDIPVPPPDFGNDYRLMLKRQIQRKYADRVIPRVGMAIEFYDFVEIREAIVYPGDGKLSCGDAYYKVEFRLVVFRPSVDQWLVGSVSGCTEKGLDVSLGFFHHVHIPSSYLRTPYAYDSFQKMWVWRYINPDTKESVNFFYEKDELIRFRVISVDFPTAPGSGAAPASEGASPITVVGAVDLDGLGCVSWWPDCLDFEEPEEEVGEEVAATVPLPAPTALAPE